MAYFVEIDENSQCFATLETDNEPSVVVPGHTMIPIDRYDESLRFKRWDAETQTWHEA